jgi:hypothetical protein
MAVLREVSAVCVVAACAALALGAAHPAQAAPTNEQCENRVNDTTAKLLECIQEPALYRHLAALQTISNDHPGSDGHGNRDTGKPGYKASVEYVAALVRRAGYRVIIQPYPLKAFDVVGEPHFEAAGRDYMVGRDWYVARLSGEGAPSAPVQPVGQIVTDDGADSRSGCSRADFTSFVRGHIALVQRGGCSLDAKVVNAEAAGAAGLILFNLPGPIGQASLRGTPHVAQAYPAHLQSMAHIPVVGVAAYDVGSDLYRRYLAGENPVARLDIMTKTGGEITDYNLIADSPFGDANHVVVVDAHLDAIYGAGILDNGTGSATILEIALKLAKTPTLNRLRFIWFGGEELGLFGSKYYTGNLTAADLKRIVFDLDADVTATPNYAILIADPQNASNVQNFPKNVVPQSRIGNAYFLRYFTDQALPIRDANAGNDGTDSNSFSLVGVPNSGIFTQQDCCKQPSEVAIWGGYLGNFEGDIPSYDGGCVDQPQRWCDNLPNVAPYVHEFVSKGFAFVTLKLANDARIDGYTR